MAGARRDPVGAFPHVRLHEQEDTSCRRTRHSCSSGSHGSSMAGTSARLASSSRGTTAGTDPAARRPVSRRSRRYIRSIARALEERLGGTFSRGGRRWRVLVSGPCRGAGGRTCGGHRSDRRSAAVVAGAAGGVARASEIEHFRIAGTGVEARWCPPAGALRRRTIGAHRSGRVVGRGGARGWS
jgi:hypothetical protein